MCDIIRVKRSASCGKVKYSSSVHILRSPCIKQHFYSGPKSVHPCILACTNKNIRKRLCCQSAVHENSIDSGGSWSRLRLLFHIEMACKLYGATRRSMVLYSSSSRSSLQFSPLNLLWLFWDSFYGLCWLLIVTKNLLLSRSSFVAFRQE